jgi:arginyl-tRNA synthetase
MPSNLSLPARIATAVAESIADLLRRAGAEPAQAPPPAVERSKPDFSSDFQSAVAMQLARLLKRKPREIAEELAPLVGARAEDLLEPVDVSGPGFLGFRLRDEALAGELARHAADSHCGTPQDGAGQTVVVDFSSPNVAKRMHIGHIRSTVIGDALRRMGLHLGYRVIGDNHIGDWGTQFGQLVYAYRNWLDEAAFAEDPVGELERLYVEFHKRAEGDEALNGAAREELRKLQAGDAANRALWEMFREKSQHTFDDVYSRLGVQFDVTYGESFYHDALGPLVQRLRAEAVAEESEGALCVFFRRPDGSEELPPFLIQKKDGAWLYATTDLATIEYRVRTWNPARIVYVTDLRQQNHFQQVFATARKMGVTTELSHVWFGVMSLPEGKFSSRQGNVIRLDELLDEADRRARELLRARAASGEGETFEGEDLDRLAHILGIGAVKYADLSNNPQSNVVFSFDKMLAFDGNTAPYLQYTSARASSLAKKAGERGAGEADGQTLVLRDPSERDLLLHLLDFGRNVRTGFDAGKPNLLASYLYELATKYHRWYTVCPVLKAEEEGLRMSRLNLNALTRKTLAMGLDLLGIGAPERM